MDDIVNAVAEGMIDAVGGRVEAVAGMRGFSPVDRLLAISQALQNVGGEPYERDLVEAFHRPENRAVHDRMSERIMARLAPTLDRVIADGIAANLFRRQDTRFAAAFVLGSFTSLHHVVNEPGDMPAALARLDTFILRGLGYAVPSVP